MRRHVSVIFHGVEIGPRQLVAPVGITVVGLMKVPTKNEMEHDEPPTNKKAAILAALGCHLTLTAVGSSDQDHRN
jgi:hypothetical protein